ncbi:MAG TPA: hypothetical protein VMW47_05420 [Verrucomicrobiae bacterium]|nr:hypothetical protein [Verrucomicrobiae bacterium]
MPTFADAIPVQRRAIGIAKETTKGTYAVPTAFVPVKTFVPKDVIDPLKVQYLGGSMTEDYGYLQGIESSAITMTGDFFPDTWAWPLAALLGDITTTGSVAPFSHACSLLNSGNGQPGSHSVTDAYGATSARAFTAVQWDNVTLTASADGLLTASAAGMGLISATETNPTTTLTGVLPIPAWEFTLTFNTESIYFTTAAVTLARRNQVIKALSGTQTPAQIFCGSLAVSWKITAIADPGDTALLNYLNNTQPVTTLSGTSGTGASETGLTVVSNKCAIEVGDIVQRGEYLEVELTGTGIANTTNAGASGGESPVLVTIINGQNASYA